MMIRFISFIEGEKYSKNEIPSKFNGEDYFKKNKDGTLTSKVCGISILNRDTYIFLPKGSFKNCDSDYKLKVGKRVFKSLMKYKESVRLTDEESDWLGEDSKEIEYIDTIEWILKDYFQNGIYYEQNKKQEMNGKGKINWAKTIKQTLPYINDSKLLYLDVITNKNQTNSNIISIIHNNVIFECIEEFGWLFDINIKLVKMDIPISSDHQITILKSKLREVFSTYEITLLQNMIKYLESKNSQSDDVHFNLLTPYYYYVWEEMLRSAMEHNEKLQNFVPKPYWEINNKKKYSKQIPDILLERNNNLIIMDAKYYSIRTNNVQKFPGWESIVKQMYYSMSLSHLYNDIQNIFLMPEMLINENKKYIGKTAVEGKESQFGYVYAYSLDINLVLKSYLREDNLNHILGEIIKNIGLNKT
ncbi:LlaJI family restriction endonuclease [Mammaliicoccus fleurettii]|uniref:LlaJI family restriction endonuclease n=1 Tax=Mammaliicoccus fleurettii TaxID=150056 RepID=A0ABS5MM39_9STAP|nr:LlaJI family restriction endonuclease [Mammaliicoccus fleurettii]MBL0847224.1 LlaJI family restriction endonuclease [Mammaliicoccus fleurettii]MBS3672130.1 LlaJI family restriction endonuclease [Mammaliicoccus fleurettii]MBS3696974.1 LlaJI family restriction endonuclease [Mammaliicoccus fleurettii]